MKIVALDFETSGLDPKRHAPVSLGVAVMADGVVLESFEWTIAPPMRDGKVTREYDVCALEINGKSWKSIKAGTSALDTCRELLTAMERLGSRESTVVAFNAPFDFSFYSELLFMAGSWNQALRRFELFNPPLIGPWQCSRYLACEHLSLDRYDLDTVCAHFGLSRSGEAHGALEDAILAGQVYHHLTESLKAKEQAA